MLRRLFPLLLGWLATAAVQAADDIRPNFIVINIDDLGYADIGPFGSTNRTPHLDRMAAEGRKLLSHYAAPVCSPSRASLMTGCYPKRVLSIPHVLFPGAAVGLNPEEVTIADALKTAGYKTACIGKWHLGDAAEFLPTRQGFDTYFGIPYSNDMGPAAEGAKSNPGQPLPAPKQDDPKARAAAAAEELDGTGIRRDQPPLPLMENDKVIARVRAEDQYGLTRQYTERAVQFIRAQKDAPFFLYLPHTAVHFPLYPGKDAQGKSPNGLLGDWVEELDANVGQILDTLRELKLAEKTLVIFTSDNGGSLPHGSRNTPLRGSKGQTFEGGIRVCTIAWWPGRIAPGSSTDAITSMMDLLPTLARLGGAKLSLDRKIDGMDIWPVLAGDAQGHEHFYYFRGLRLNAVRSGPWKLHLPVTEKPDKAGNIRQTPLLLYHLGDDIAESKNVAAEHPEIVARLQALAAGMDADLGTTEAGPGCRPLGRVERGLPLISADGTVRVDAVGTQPKFP